MNEELAKQVYCEVDGETYQLVENYREAFELETFQERYSEILKNYDYIVGDFSHGQLRLKGFYYNTCKGAPRNSKIATLEDYLLEYCSFGCAYFVLERISGKPAKYIRKNKHKKKN